jgi:hypothetical protein
MRPLKRIDIDFRLVRDTERFVGSSFYPRPLQDVDVAITCIKRILHAGPPRNTRKTGTRAGAPGESFSRSSNRKPARGGIERGKFRHSMRTVLMQHDYVVGMAEKFHA